MFPHDNVQMQCQDDMHLEPLHKVAFRILDGVHVPILVRIERVQHSVPGRVPAGGVTPTITRRVDLSF